MTLRIAAGSEDRAKAVAVALEADNARSTAKVSASCHHEGYYVTCIIRVLDCSEPRALLTLRNTADDILLAARAAIEGMGRAGIDLA